MPDAGFTARGTSRAVAKAVHSEPTVAHRSAEDQRIKATPGISTPHPSVNFLHNYGMDEFLQENEIIVEG